MTSKAESAENNALRLRYLQGQLNLLKDALMTGEISAKVYHKSADPLGRKISQTEGQGRR
jgi:hypothetical protein